MVAGFAQPGLLDDGLAVAAGPGQHEGGPAYRWTWLRLSAGLVFRSAMGGVCALRSRRYRVVVAGYARWAVAEDDFRRRCECGASIFAGREAVGVCVDVL